MTRRRPRLLFIDSGLGGLTVLRAARQAIPEADVHFIADDDGFPYGSKTDDALVSRLLFVADNAVRDFDADCLVLACNTASTVALDALRARFPLPITGTVPAIKPAAALTKSGLVSVLATPGTVSRDYTRDLISRYGNGASFTLVGSPDLATLAEAFASGLSVSEGAIRDAIAPCFVESEGAKTDVVVLGCTHYPLLIEKFEVLAPWPVTWLDPAPAIARRVANLLAGEGHIIGVGTPAYAGTFRFTSGRSPSTALTALLASHRLEAVDRPNASAVPLNRSFAS